MTSQGMSPYQPGEATTQPPELPQRPSSIPKVMGILHLVFGGLGLVSTTQGLVQGNTFSSSLQGQMGGVEGASTFSISPATLGLLEGVDQANSWLLGFDLLVCIAMVIAGIGLVKYKKWGRLCSNLYVSGSLMVKVATGYILLVVAKPFFEALVAENEMLQVLGVAGIQGLLAASMFLGGCYAVATAILVNRKSSRRSLA